ncbi:5687_t:CDS:2 [Funneliformis caledonium]|uniref:Protein ARV n=2 Tax=Funneliformis TaxID=1117308 RepID=A0A9N8VDD1_9GLOM|nr:5687_t:CDS:2 [Funneliformis caledonium]CAG8612018.1 7088_t:CDS:2 [Funneliformis mosseae]
MPTCVECGVPVTNLYTEYSKGNIRLTHCEICNKFADKYVEHDFVIIFIDMLLHKPQVYRHLLFNRLEYRDHGIDPNVLKLEFVVFQFGLRLAVSLYIGDKYAIVKYNYITIALIISSFGKILLILMVIWDYNEFKYSWLINIVVITSNVEALEVFLNIGYCKTLLILIFGLGLKVLAQILFIKVTNSPLLLTVLSI